MKNLFEYLENEDNIEYINEWGTKNVSKDNVDANEIKPKDVTKLKANMGDKEVVSGKDAIKKIKNIAGKNADDNGTEGLWEIDAPVEDMPALNKAELRKELENDENLAEICAALDEKKSFFVIGEAGWGKTSVIEAAAKRFGRTVLTVYLDKAEATDLGGIPVPKTGVFGRFKKTSIDYAIPGWALYMLAHPEKKFLLFFDEMNQAAPDVQNALMPIVLRKVICGIKFDNFIVGAAGNYAYENEAVSDLSGPLRSRFKYIEWESRTPEQWEAHFNWAHKKYDNIIGPEIINKVAEYQNFWKSPRDITRYIYEFCENAKNEDFDIVTPKKVFAKSLNNDCIHEPARDNNGRKIEKAINDITDYIYEWIDNKGTAETDHHESRRKSSSSDQIDPKIKEGIAKCLKVGKYPAQGNIDGKSYLLTLENTISDEANNKVGLFNVKQTNVTAEILEKIVQQMEDGTIGSLGRCKPKYNTVEDGIKQCKKMGRENLIIICDKYPNGDTTVADVK